MGAGTVSDHGSLALLAQNQEADLRPLLLRVQVRNFVDAPRRDAATKASFEAIALGLIPLVPDDALADAALLLRDHPDAPRPVLRALLSQLDRAVSRASEEPDDLRRDLDLAGDAGIALAGEALERLVGRAIGHRGLAQALLARPEPGVFDRAALYRHGEELQRATIRHDLARALASLHLPRPTGSGAAARDMLRIAAGADFGALRAATAGHLDVSPEPLDIADAAGRELFLFALMAVGLDEAECIRALLLLDTPQSRSVPVIFHLADLARATSWPVAAFLAGCERVVSGRPAAEPSPGIRRSAQPRAEPIQPLRRADRTGPDRAPSARLDRRS